jgi:hypothetical protein
MISFILLGVLVGFVLFVGLVVLLISCAKDI